MKYGKLSFLKKLGVLCFSVLWSIQLLAQDVKPSQSTPTNQTVKPPQISALAQNLSKIGAFSCAERANQISNFLSPNGQHELIMQTPKDNVNNRLLMSSIVIKGDKGTSILASISLAPNQINGCGGSYRTVFHSQNICSKASNALFPKEKFQNIGMSNAQIAVVNRALWIIAMPIDRGCIFIKEEIIE